MFELAEGKNEIPIWDEIEERDKQSFDIKS